MGPPNWRSVSLDDAYDSSSPAYLALHGAQVHALAILHHATPAIHIDYLSY